MMGSEDAKFDEWYQSKVSDRISDLSEEFITDYEEGLIDEDLTGRDFTIVEFTRNGTPVAQLDTDGGRWHFYPEGEKYNQ